MQDKNKNVFYHTQMKWFRKNCHHFYSVLKINQFYNVSMVCANVPYIIFCPKFIGNRYLKDGQYQEAVDCYSEAIELVPNSVHSATYYCNRYVCWPL